jgi:hypothetical protein
MRYKVIVDVTGLESKEAVDYVKKYKNAMKRKKLINPLTGRLDTTKLGNILDPTDDFFIGARKDGVTPDVGTVSEQGTLGQINDVLYFQNKLFATLKLPKSFMAYEKDVNAKATLAVQDVEFGRMVRRLQTFLSGFVKTIFDYELVLKGIKPESVEYEIKFANVSLVDEAQQAATKKVIADTGIALVGAGIVTEEYVATEMLQIPEDEYAEMKKLIDKRKQEAASQELQQLQQMQQMSQPAQPGGPLAGKPGKSAAPLKKPAIPGPKA